MSKIWIDITNSPHVLFFEPMIKKLEQRGHEILITSRDYAQTQGLLKRFNINHTCIGKNQGKSKFKKVLGLFSRSHKLMKLTKGQKFDVALSLGSLDLCVAAKLKGIPHITLTDYEFIKADRFTFRMSKKIFVPDCVDVDFLFTRGAKVDKLVRYPMLKENFYIAYMPKDPDYLQKEYGIEKDKIVCAFRTQATMAHYQNHKDHLDDDALEYLEKNDVITICLPRTEDQKIELKNRKYKNVIIPEKALDGISLIYSCDFVISAGGTMNREAAALNIPAYSIFNGGNMCVVDNMLIERGIMKHIKESSEINSIKLEKTEKQHIDIIDTSDLYIKTVEEVARRG